MFRLGFVSQNSLYPGGQGPHLTRCVVGPMDPATVPAKWHLNPLNRFSRMHRCDKPTEHATKKYVAMGEIVCTASSDSA